MKMSNQYELELGYKTVEDYYVDQSPKGGNVVSSVYTPHGIKAIDSQYCALIMNLHREIKQVYRIARRKSQYSNIKTRKVEEFSIYHTYYDPIDLSEHTGYGEIRIEWEGGIYRDFYYGKTPKFNLKTRNTDPELLKQSIIECPNLHTKIKENLANYGN
jgi:hypothetical protein